MPDSTVSPAGPLLLGRQAAERLGISAYALRDLVNRGILRPHPAFNKGTWQRFRAEDVETLLAGEIPPDPREAA
jgi:Helix-turn-helix domain